MSTITTAARPLPASPSRTRRLLVASGATYIIAWLLGLFAAPSAPSPSASDATVTGFFAAHPGATLVQAVLVHALAGVALAGFVVALAAELRAHGPAVRRVFVTAGLGAVVLSLVQFALEVALNRHFSGDGGAATTATLFHAVNDLDAAKLVVLGLATAAGARLAMRTVPSWVRWLGYALLPVLIAGACAFIVDSGPLGTVLAASLVLLLLWVAAVTVVVARRR